MRQGVSRGGKQSQIHRVKRAQGGSRKHVSRNKHASRQAGKQARQACTKDCHEAGGKVQIYKHITRRGGGGGSRISTENRAACAGAGLARADAERATCHK